MTEINCFVQAGQGSPDVASSVPPEHLPGFGRMEPAEGLRVLAIGTPDAVNDCVLTLYRLGYARVDEWSWAVPTGNGGEVMRILTKRCVK